MHTMRKNLVLALVILCALLLSGCISMDVTQRLNRDGTFDLDMTLTSEAEGIFENMHAGEVQVDEGLKDKMEVTQLENGMHVSFKSIDPQEYESFMDESAENNELTFLDSANVKIEREIQFPYEVFTYTISNNQPEKAFNPTNYVFDNVDLYSQEQEEEMHTQLIEMYEQDTLEVIVHSQLDLEDESSLVYTTEFAQNVDRINPSGPYVMVFTMESEPHMCEINHNLVFYGDIGTYLDSLKADTALMQLCAQDPAQWGLSVVNQLHTYLQTHEITPPGGLGDVAGAAMQSLFDITFSIEVFGSIVDTNGEKVAVNKATWDLTEGHEEFMVSFKVYTPQAFMKIGAWLLFIGMIALIAFVLWQRILKKSAERRVHPKVLGFVRRQSLAGMSEQEIKHILRKKGLSDSQIRGAFRIK